MRLERRSKNERDWDLSLLRYELEQLRREREHLFSKQNERPLTHFERERVDSIAAEMTALIRSVVTFNRQIKAGSAA